MAIVMLDLPSQCHHSLTGWQQTRKQTALEQSQTDRVSLALNLTQPLTFNPLYAMVIIYAQTKVQGQRSVGSRTELKQMNRQTNGGN